MKKIILFTTITLSILFPATSLSKNMEKYFKNPKTIEKLNPTSYYVTQKNGTEKPFINKFFLHFERGIYVDIVSNEPLFLSTHKFLSKSGWPSFTQPIFEYINEVPDTSHGMVRTEIRSKYADSHLGHVFDDGPRDKGGLRYCINSAALIFIPIDDMKNKGYEKYIKYVE